MQDIFKIILYFDIKLEKTWISALGDNLGILP